jgi:hypothetical protein
LTLYALQFIKSWENMYVTSEQSRTEEEEEEEEEE